MQQANVSKIRKSDIRTTVNAAKKFVEVSEEFLGANNKQFDLDDVWRTSIRLTAELTELRMDC